MTVVVVGGGITGLAAAHALGKAGVETLLVEESTRLGGKIRTEIADGFVIEHGPDSFVAFRPAGIALIRELGLGDAIIAPREPRRVSIRSRGRNRRFPDGMGLVLPTKFRPFATSDLLSPLQKLRIGLDLILPRSRQAGDVSIGRFLRRRLGNALVDRLAGPLIGGVYGTPIDELSLDAVVPQLRIHEREHRSLLLATIADIRARSEARRAAAATPTSGTKANPPTAPFVTLARGTEQLIDALAGVLGTMPSVTTRTGVAVESLQREVGGLHVRLSNGEGLVPAAVIIATPAPVAARLLRAAAPEAAAAIRSIGHGSTAVVNLVFDASQLPLDPTNHGFLVAGDEPTTISACTISSNKWAGRAPEGSVLVRAFIGGGRSSAGALDDAELVAAATADVSTALDITGAPRSSRITRYPGAMPQYTVGHLDRVATAETALAAALPNVFIAGGAYRGVGLPDCIAQGQAAAQRVIGTLAAARSSTTMDPAAPTTAPAIGAASARSDLPTLDRLPLGTPARVFAIEGSVPDLALEGVHPGTRLAVTSRSPLGGPLIVSMDRARIAVAKSVARRVTVEPLPADEPGIEAANEPTAAPEPEREAAPVA